MLTPEEIERIPGVFEKILTGAEKRILEDIIRKIKATGEISSASDWQINRLMALGNARTTVTEAIKEALNISYDEVDKLYLNVIEKDYVRNKAIYEMLDIDYTPYDENKALQQLVEGVKEQTRNEIKNITRSTGFVRKENGKVVYSDTLNTYQRLLDNAVTDISSGALDYNTVLKRTIKELQESGLRTVDYESGRKIRVESAVKTAVMTGLRQVTSKITDDNARKLNTEHFQVSWHRTARPSHQIWQGRVYTRDELYSECGLDEVDGLCGANCYHSYDPFIPGISIRLYTDEELDKMNAEENEKREYRGKEYTLYEATQRQRALERRIKSQREGIKLLEIGAADENDIIAAKSRYRSTMAQYADFSKQMGLPQEMKRVYAGDNANKIVENTSGSDIIKSGAVSGARNPYGEAANEHAQRYYGLVRSMKTDVEKIAKTTGFSEKDIQSVKDYLFISKHDLGAEDMKQFDPDYMIGESWRRLIDGKPELHDITLLNHELMEKELTKKGIPQNEAHILTSKKYNYGKEAYEFYDKIKKYRKE